MLDDELRATDAKLTPHASLIGTPGGDVWIADTGVTKLSLVRSADDSRWQHDVQPVFARVCAHCHLPGGSADVDLSTAAAWTTEHDELVRRVIATRTMPPAGTAMSESDRAALAGFLGVRQ